MTSCLCSEALCEVLLCSGLVTAASLIARPRSLLQPHWPPWGFCITPARGSSLCLMRSSPALPPLLQASLQFLLLSQALVHLRALHHPWCSRYLSLFCFSHHVSYF